MANRSTYRLVKPLEQMEADVVFVAENPVTGMVWVQPFWECGMTEEEVKKASVRFGLEFVERCGMGLAEVTVWDWRKEGEIPHA